MKMFVVKTKKNYECALFGSTANNKSYNRGKTLMDKIYLQVSKS